MRKNGPLVLLILDGFGYNDEKKYNAIAAAHTPQWDEWWTHCPHTLLEASGAAVGLPEGQMGNSEVGHMHIGAGRVIPQQYTEINQAIRDGSFASHTVLNQGIQTLKKTGKALHIMGLLSEGGIHSHQDHLFTLLALCHQHHFNSVFLHVFLDGRDCPPESALKNLRRLNQELKRHPVAVLASISGRYFAMDRDNRWDRISRVYTLLTEGVSEPHFDTAEDALTQYYQQGLSDEFIPPSLIGQAQVIEDGDMLLYFNFRADRARALTETFVNPNFNGFERRKKPHLAEFISMTLYDKKLQTTVLFPPTPLKNTLGEVLAAHGLRQLRLAETEKYAHVTFFFNGGKEEPLDNEVRLLIPSPKIATYDLKPEMSAKMLTEHLIDAIKSGKYEVIICNYANADMVGHTGDLKASILAIECLDDCFQHVSKALEMVGGRLLITADHGNAEIMYDEKSQQPHTAHTCQPVPFLYVTDEYHFKTNKASLIDVAPSLLYLLGLPIPPEMTGKNLLEKNHG